MKTQISHSRPARNTEEILTLISAPGSKPFYDATLAFLTHEYQSVSSFGKAAIVALNNIPSQVETDCYADVIRILDGLVQAGLAKSKMTVVTQGEYETVVGSRVEYALI
jgi:hypothetical protein